MKNIAEDYDTYTYIKPHIMEKDGHSGSRDIVRSIRLAYESGAVFVGHHSIPQSDNKGSER